jgi:hypothetical protein
MTNKAGRLVQFESWAERALLLRLDRDPDVADYGSQPEQFQFVDPQGKWRRYTPDFIVWRRDGQVEIHEVTLARRRSRPEILRREIAAAEICLARQWRYRVHSEQSLPQGSELANLLALFRYRPAAYAHPAVARAACQYLGQRGAMALGALVAELTRELDLTPAQVIAAVGHLLWHGYLATDLQQLLFAPGRSGAGSEAPVWLGSAAEEGQP